MSGEVVLYDYWRSSASYRVRIALNLKQIAHRTVPINLLEHQQEGEAYRALNPQGLVPALAIDGQLLTQSLAIIDYLEQTRPQAPLLPADPAARARVLAQALMIAADVHPLNNLRVLAWLKGELGAEQSEVTRWYHHWIAKGFDALELQAPEGGLLGGAEPNLADVMLVPQMSNARRFELPLDPWPRLVRIDQALREMPAFAAAAPEAVKK